MQNGLTVKNNDLENVLRITDEKNISDLEKAVRSFASRMQIYRAGIKEIRTKLEILDEEFKTKYDYNPIHSIESRLKSPPKHTEKGQVKGFAGNY